VIKNSLPLLTFLAVFSYSMTKIFSKLFGLCLILITAQVYAQTSEFKLENGLKVIVITNKRAPIVTSQLWYKVGSSYELSGKTGISHALEHMMFKGSSKLKPGESSIILRKLGVIENAYTTNDYTVYHQFLASNKLNVVLEMEADRMATLTLPYDEFKREIEVIKEERRLRVDDNPSHKAYERFLAGAYIASGYRHPVIGWMEDIERISNYDLRAWYKKWYAPNNATLVIAGDVTIEQVKPMVQKWFGKIAAKQLPPNIAPVELIAPYERRLKLQSKVKVPELILGFNVPSLVSAKDKKEVYALLMAAAILSGDDASRFERELVRGSEIANSASADFYPFNRGDSLFVFRAKPNVQKGKNLKQVEDAIWQQIKNLKRKTPSAKELAKIRAQIVADMIYQQDSLESQAYIAGMLESIGLSWRDFDQIVKEFSNVSALDVQNAVRKYLVKERSTTAWVESKGK